MDKRYIADEYDNINVFYKIPGTTIDNWGVYYKSANTFYNHGTYTGDPNFEEDYEYYDDPYQSYFEGLFNTAYNADPKQPVIFDSNGDPLAGPLYYNNGAYLYRSGALKDIGYCREVVQSIIINGKFVVQDVSQLVGNDVYTEYENSGGLSIRGDDVKGSKLLRRNGNSYTIVKLYGLSDLTYVSDIGSMPRMRIGYTVYDWNDKYHNNSYLLNTVDTRASCFEPLLNVLRSNDFDDSYISENAEAYGPYILNRVGRCVTITHAPDIDAYSIINFGDNTSPVVIFTDPDPHNHENCIIDDYWRGGNVDGYSGNPTTRPGWGTDGNADSILSRMRDYRATHRYASNGTYTITIETYAIHDIQGSSDGTEVTHTTTSYSVTVTSADSQDIIYFKVPEQFDHLYINGVRCPLVERGDGYNVVGLDVTDYNWLLGKVCAGRRDVVICKLPLLSSTNYTKYTCNIAMTRSGNGPSINYNSTFDMLYDSKSQLYYVDDLATKTGIADINCPMYGDPDDLEQYGNLSFTITISGVDQSNTSTELIEYESDEFPDGRILTESNSSGVEIVSHYYGWQPYFTRGSIQVAEFENDYVRNTTDSLPYVRGSRSYPEFMSDYTNMVGVLSVFGGDAVAPVSQQLSPLVNTVYETSFDPSSGTTGAIAVLTEACIGKTYDLRNAVPWKTFFPGCYCVDAPLSLYD
jgi:hypothetical protein